MFRDPTSRRAGNVLAALLLAFAFLHCAFEWQAEVQHHFAAAYRAAGEPLPIGSTPGCDHDTGCLCKGAISAQSLDTGCLSADVLSFLSGPGDAQQLASSDDLPSAPLASRDCHGPPLSGRQLRALYASLVI